MRHRPLAVAGLTAALAAALAVGAPGAVAAPASGAAPTAFGPTAPAQSRVTACSNSPRDLPITAFTDHDELRRDLAGLERLSRGRVDVEQIGTSNRGREIWSARVGTGPTAVLLTSEIHGNEKVGTEAVLELLKFVGTSPSAQAQRWRDELTIVAVPKMNPDAAELDRRGNDQTWAEVGQEFPQLVGAPPSWNYYTTPRQGDDYAARPGFDVNRDYHYDLDYVPQAADLPGSSREPGFYITPESQTVRDLYVDLTAEFGVVDTYVDLHHQGACYVMPDDPDTFVTLSISGQFVADPATKPEYAEYADGYDLDYSKQLNVALNNRLQAEGERRNNPFFSAITLYPQNLDLPGTGLGAFALNGSGTVLFEIRGQSQTLGQQYRAQLTRATYLGLEGMMEALATDTVRTLDPAEYDAIPPRGPDIGTRDAATLSTEDDADPLSREPI